MESRDFSRWIFWNRRAAIIALLLNVLSRFALRINCWDIRTPSRVVSEFSSLNKILFPSFFVFQNKKNERRCVTISGVGIGLAFRLPGNQWNYLILAFLGMELKLNGRTHSAVLLPVVGGVHISLSSFLSRKCYTVFVVSSEYSDSRKPRRSDPPYRFTFTSSYRNMSS